MNSKILKAAASSWVGLAAAVHLAAADAGRGFDLKLVAEGFVSPTVLVPAPNSDGTLLVADQAGVIRVLGKDGKVADQSFLDLRTKLIKLNQGFDERGLLGFVLHPKFSENKKFYVAYSAPKRAEALADWDHTTRVAEYTAAPDGQSAILDSEKVILEWDQPYFNHNGGTLVFGPNDGYLYITSGDGGNAHDRGRRPPEGNGQNLQTLLGKILRIDVNGGNPYSIPRDNPFAGTENIRPEIYAYGLRNPWRISFDRGGSHELFAADVGQDGYEEVDIIVKGGNYGWNIREGMHCFDPKNPRQEPADCPKVGASGEPLIDPIMEYKNFKNHPRDPEAKGISITGGHVYRGKALPHWTGKYIFADWSAVMVKPAGVLFAGTRGQGGRWSWETVTPATTKTTFYITALGEDADGELYLLTNDSNGLSGNTGKVYKIVPQTR
jgi:glucose/arabinose dehydrogenase